MHESGARLDLGLQMKKHISTINDMEVAMRTMVFKMERSGLLTVGQKVTVTEGVLPSNYYYTIDPSLAMSGNIPPRERMFAREGVVTDIVENERGFYVTAEFDE